jgi:transposase
MTQHTKVDYSGQHIFVGIDVARKGWVVTILTETIEHQTATRPPSVESLASYLFTHFPGATYHAVYEAGFSGFWIHEAFKRLGIACCVVNPGDVPTTDRERVFKTDRIDSRKLANSLRAGLLGSIHVPSRDVQEERSLLRLRQSLVRKQTRCKNQIKALLCLYGINVPADVMNAHWSKRYLAALEQIQLDTTSGTYTIRTYLAELTLLRESVATTTREIRTLAQTDRYRDNVRWLISIPGISTLTAMILLTEIDDVRRFSDSDHLASYVGLVPGERSSGEQEIITGISRRRNTFLRTALIESAWVGVRKDPVLLQCFNELAHRMAKQKAIVRIARKLLNRIWFVLIHQTNYRPAMAA